MNVAIIGSNCLVESMIQRFSLQDNVENIYTYDLPDYMCSWPKVTNTPMIGDMRQFWLREAELMSDKQLDLILATGLLPQLWRELHHTLKKCGVPVLIPSPDTAWLEWSKAETKTLLRDLKIPTPLFEVVSYEEAADTFKQFPRPYVLKYDREYREGLQTLIITDDNVDEQYAAFLEYGQMKISPGFSPKQNTLFVREEFVKGKEYSYHVLCNGTDCTFIGAARDYKKRYEGDVGYNTVGMGAYSPVDYIDHAVINYAKTILSCLPVPYIGIMYLGILVDEDNNHLLLEVNTRFGDPEFSAILPTISSDILQLFVDAAQQTTLTPVEFNDGRALSLRLVHKDYSLFEKPNSKLPTFDACPSDIAITNSFRSVNFGPMITTIQSSLTESADKLHRYVATADLGDFTYRKDVGYFE